MSVTASTRAGMALPARPGCALPQPLVALILTVLLLGVAAGDSARLRARTQGLPLRRVAHGIEHPSKAAGLIIWWWEIRGARFPCVRAQLTARHQRRAPPLRGRATASPGRDTG